MTECTCGQRHDRRTPGDLCDHCSHDWHGLVCRHGGCRCQTSINTTVATTTRRWVEPADRAPLLALPAPPPLLVGCRLLSRLYADALPDVEVEVVHSPDCGHTC